MWTTFWMAFYYLAHLALVVRAITRPNRTPAARAAWVAVILAVPFVGFVCYLALGETSIGKTRVRRLHEAEADLAEVPAIAPAAAVDRGRSLSDLCRSINGFAPVAGNSIQLLGDPDAPPSEPKRDSVAGLDRLIADIDGARESVHLSFYIWLDDDHGGKVADAVAAAATRGVVCRVMADALGSRAFVNGPRWKQLGAAGVHLLATLNDIPRLGPFALGRIDLRNHRKLAVIDGRVAYCGSQNCADPEFRVKAEFAPWIDLLFRCEGPIVDQAQRLFLGTWTAETGEEQTSMVGTAPAAGEPAGAGAVAQLYGTGPTTRGNAMSDSLVGALYEARHELLITTPYLVPDEALLRALCAAPRRGVATTLILPARNDSKLVAAASQNAYAAMLDGGVEIHEYPLGILHSKSITIDGRIALVGSANLDRRSLELNFENNLLILDEETTQAIRARQLGYLSVSRAVPREEVAAWRLGRRTVQATAAIASPVL